LLLYYAKRLSEQGGAMAANDTSELNRACEVAYEYGEEYDLLAKVGIARAIAARAKDHGYPDAVKSAGWLSPLVSVNELVERLQRDALISPQTLGAAILAQSPDEAPTNPVAHVVRLLDRTVRIQA